jgi:hypothetical protein
MNLNFFRTIMGVFTGGGIGTVIYLIAQLAGCTIDDPATAVNEITSCTESKIIPAQWTAFGTFIFLGLGAFAKMLKGGTIKENLLAPSVPMVPAADNRPGVVSAAQVNSGTK